VLPIRTNIIHFKEFSYTEFEPPTFFNTAFIYTTNSPSPHLPPVGPDSGIQIIKVASENQLADTFTKGLAFTQFSMLMGWSAEAREGVSRIDLTKYLVWSLLGTERPGTNDCAECEVRQAHWWKNAKDPIARERATAVYDGCKQRQMRPEPG
jgi:hypothetical protein